ALLVLVQGGSELDEHADARGSSAGKPVTQNPPGGAQVGLVPNLPQVFLEVVGGGQRQVELERFVQTFPFVAFGIEVLRVLEQKPARSLEYPALRIAAQLPVEFAAKGGELLVEQLDDVEVIEDV